MNRIDWVVVRRLLATVGLTLVVLYGLVALVESLSTSRFQALSRIGGPQLAILAIAVRAARWIIDTLPLTVLIGAIAALLNLQSTREITVIKASGVSVWRLMVGPFAMAVAGGLFVIFVAHALIIQLDRSLSTAGNDANANSEEFWMQERRGPLHYILQAGYVHPGGEALGNVTVFMLDPPRERIEAEAALLERDAWHFPTATRFSANRMPEGVADLRLPTSTSPGDMRARLSSVKDMTIYEMASSMASRINDPEERARVFTRFLRLIALPLSLAGSLVIAFAFTAGYRRTNKYGGMVLYGIVLGFVVYVVTEMAGRAGDAGVIQPVLAALGPAMVAIVAGATVLLNREDGQT